MTKRFFKQNSTIFYKEESKQQKRTPRRHQACANRVIARYASNSEKPPGEQSHSFKLIYLYEKHQHV